MPLRFALSPRPGQELTIDAPGALTTIIDLQQQPAQGLVPILPLSPSLRQLRWRLSDGSQGTIAFPLKPLPPDQCLLGLAAGNPQSLSHLFPEKSVVPIRLDPANPIPGPAVAWSTLDAIVLDPAQAATIGPNSIAQLLAAQTTIIVLGNINLPIPPTRKTDQFTLFAPPFSPPLASPVLPAAFAPVAGWHADWPKPFRVRILLISLIITVILLAVALLPPPFSALAGLLVSAASVLAIALLFSPVPVLQKGGDIVLQLPDLRQIDSWNYFASPTNTIATFHASASTWPVFMHESDPLLLNLTLLCQADGLPDRFQFRLSRGVSAAFLSRSLSTDHLPQSAPHLPTDIHNPLLRLARRLYLQPGDPPPTRLANQFTTTGQTFEYWPTLFIRRTHAPSTQP